MSDIPSVSVTLADVEALCHHFKKNPYSVSTETPEAAEALAKCKAMLELDYNVVEINNAGGVLCAHYPSKILICESQLPIAGTVAVKNEALQLETEADINQLRNQILKARKGRCRARFPVPVIFFNGKNICRSGTTAHYREIIGRTTVEAISSYLIGTSEDESRGDEESFNDEQNLGLENSVRNHDVQLLRMYNANTIFDLMLEYQKVKYGVYVTSSEQADKGNRYSDFNIINVPYPGCEFFYSFYHNGKQGSNLKFKWSENVVYKTLTIPDDALQDCQIKWKNYKKWDIATLTTNYLIFILRYIKESNSGILIHCISGWDRTPLFISLLRLSLWADGLIHKSLSPVQMLYFTIAYDWMLFGHNLKNRLEKCEEIFFFCFYMLKHVMHERCSITRDQASSQSTLQRDSQSADNGNLEFMDEELRRSNQSLCSISSNASNSSHDQNILFEHRESETENDMTMEFESENNEFGTGAHDLSGEVSLLLDQDIPTSDNFMDTDRSDSHSSSESNGNNADDRTSNSSEQDSPDSSPRNVAKSSPLPMTRRGVNRDDGSNSSWTFVTSTGSIHSNDSGGRRRVFTSRHRKLSRVRKDFYKVYYYTASVPYNEQASTISQVIGNLAERVGFSS